MALSLSTNAAIISHNGYTHDTTTTSIFGGGLEWLQWDQTLGKSYNDVRADATYSSWRLATNLEVATLFNAFAFGTTIFDSDRTTYQLQTTSWSASETSTHNYFISLFGTTFLDTMVHTSTDPDRITLAVFGNPDAFDNHLNLARVVDDSTHIALGHQDSSALLFDNRFSPDISELGVGVALVRSPSQVPEPTTVTIFTLGLLSLGLNRRQRRSSKVF
jgi:predicted metalloprotease with PDZ domain